MKNKEPRYVIFKEYGKDKIQDGDKLRVDLYYGFKISDIGELKNFNIKYFTKGHKEKDNSKAVRYIEVHNKN